MTKPGFLPEDVVIVPLFLTINVRRPPRSKKKIDRIKRDTIAKVKKAIEAGFRDSPVDTLGTINLSSTNGIHQFLLDFVALCRTADMRPEDECHALYARARAFVGDTKLNPVPPHVS